MATSQYVEAARLDGRVGRSGRAPPRVAEGGAGRRDQHGEPARRGLVIVSSLTFLGIGIQPPAPTWGGMLAADLQLPLPGAVGAVGPAVLIMLTVGACNGLADVLRDVSGRRGPARSPAGIRPTPYASPRPPDRSAIRS